MEYFEQRDGEYVSRGVPGLQGRSGVVRTIVTAIPIIVLAFIYLNSGSRGVELKEVLPFLIMGSLFLFSSLLAGFMSRRGHGSGIVVDQMKGTLSFRKPRGQRHTASISELSGIGFQTAGDSMYGTGASRSGALVYLLTRDNRRVPLAFGRKVHELRQFADELSMITSLTVREHSASAE